MRIEYIKLKNYRQYKDAKIDFPPFDKKRNFVVIQGESDAGKTNLLNAITWCLYGEEMHLVKRLAHLPIVNTPVLAELKPKGICEAEVEIQMRDEEDKKIIFRRRMSFQKLEGKPVPIPDPMSNEPDGSKFEMIRQIGKDMRAVYDPSYVLQTLIPEKINEYFFFDGERLNDYFRQTAGEKIKEAVFKISQLELLDKVIDHLNEKKRDFLKTSKELTPRAEEIKDLLGTYQKSLDEYKKDFKKLKLQRDDAVKNKKEISDKLKASSVPNIKELEEERIEVEGDLERLDDRIDALVKEKSDYIIDMAPAIFAHPTIVKTKKMISGRREAGEIPPDYKKNFIKKLLEKGKCICGTDISKKDEHRKEVKRLLDECDEISNITDVLIKVHAHLGSILEEFEEFSEKRIQLGREIKGFEKEREGKSKRLKIIKEKIGRCDVEEVKRLEKKLERYEKEIGEMDTEIGEKKVRIELTDKEIKKYENELNKEIKKVGKLEELRKILSFCDDGLEAAEKTKNEIMETTRKEIEEKTRKQFFGLIWDKEIYQDVRIDEDYNISVIHQSGMKAIGSLGAAARQALALAFMAALNDISGFDVPIIIDTPLGRISGKPRKNIANNLPNYLEGKQVTLLATDQEYTSEVRERLSKRVAKEYEIEVKATKAGGISRVIPYGK